MVDHGQRDHGPTLQCTFGQLVIVHNSKNNLMNLKKSALFFVLYRKPQFYCTNYKAIVKKIELFNQRIVHE